MDAFEDGVGFDCSSIRGFKEIQESDMLLFPDPTTAFVDPFTAEPTLVLICNVKDPVTGESYSRDPRYIAQKAAAYLKSTVAQFWPPSFSDAENVNLSANKSSVSSLCVWRYIAGLAATEELYSIRASF